MNVADLTGNLVTSSRPPSRLQERPDDQTCNAGVVVQTAGGSRLTADAADEKCVRCGCSSPSCTVVLCAADIDGPLCTACTAPTEERPASAALCYEFSILLYHTVSMPEWSILRTKEVTLLHVQMMIIFINKQASKLRKTSALQYVSIHQHSQINSTFTLKLNLQSHIHLSHSISI